jgi:hypothetical protein
VGISDIAKAFVRRTKLLVRQSKRRAAIDF